MNLYGRIKYELFLMLILAIVPLALAACGGTDSGDHSGTSSVTFQVVWDRPDSFQPASLTDCEDVDTVSAEVHNSEGVLLGFGGPWDCTTGSGVISALPTNYFAFIGVAGYDADGVVLYYGQNESPVYLEPGTVDAGVIIADTFVSTLLSPADTSLVARDALELRWSSLPGAGGYRVTLAVDSSFSDLSIIRQISIDDGNTSSIRPDVTDLEDDAVYYWRVQALDGADNPGNPTAARQFSLRTVTITEVTIIDNGPVILNPITTTISFAYSSISSTQEQYDFTAEQWSVVDQWSTEMNTSDYFDLQDIVQNNALVEQGDVVLPGGYPVCAGSGSIHISITEADNSIHEFDISGQVRCYRDTLWPAGVVDLVTIEENLVGTYEP